jgi:putative phosphoesterase
MTRIVVISDTHARSVDALSQELLKTLTECDVVVHCGDYTGITVVRELEALSKRFIGVYGNVDPREIREALPEKTVFEAEGKKIGVIHPSWGGPPWEIEDDIAREFPGVDIILFGHTHDPFHETIDNVIFLNPGQAYPSFGTQASAAILTIGEEGIDVEIRTFK